MAESALVKVKLPKEVRRTEVERLYFAGHDPKEIAGTLHVSIRAVNRDLEVLAMRWRARYDPETLRATLNETAVSVMRRAREQYIEKNDTRQGHLAILAAARLSSQNGLEGSGQVNVFVGPLAQLINMAQNEAKGVIEGEYKLLEGGENGPST